MTNYYVGGTGGFSTVSTRTKFEQVAYRQADVTTGKKEYACQIYYSDQETFANT